MGEKKKTTGDPNRDHLDTIGDNAMNSAGSDDATTGAVLPDPEEIKLGPLDKSREEHRTVVDVDKPGDTNEDKDDHTSWDFRRNK